jgi:hypothetical protein
LPIVIRWLKDGSEIPTALNVSEMKAEFFNTLVFKELTPEHSGIYTCIASNKAGVTDAEANLRVNGE